jgi:hypothetical protein
LEGRWEHNFQCVLEGPVKIPSDFTIIVDDGFRLVNNGTLENFGKLENRGGFFYNDGIFLNFGSVLNDRDITNNGVIKNEGDIDNRSFFFNRGGLVNKGKIENNWDIENSGILINYDVINNKGSLDNHDIFIGEGGTFINGKSGIITNLGKESQLARMGNIYGSTTFINEGTITFAAFSVFENLRGDVSNSGRIKVDAGGTFNNWGPFKNSGTISNDSDRFYNQDGATISNTGSISSTKTLQNGGLINNSCNGSVSGKVEGNEPVDSPKPCSPTSQSTTSIELNKDSCSLDPFNGQFDSNTDICTVEGFIVGSDVSITIASGVELYNTGNGKAVNAGTINLLGGITTASSFDNSGTIIIDGDGILQTSFVEGSAVGGNIRNFGNIEIAAGVLQNAEQGSFTNLGTIVNHDRLINSNSFENLGSGTVWSEGTFANTGTITNSGKIKNCGPAISGNINGTASIEQNCMPADSGSVNYVISAGDQEFSVATALTNGVVIDIAPDPAVNRLILTIAASPSAQGELTIALPRSVIDAKSDDNGDQQFVILIDNEEADYEETGTTDVERALKIATPAGASKIDIIGTQVVPEFPISLLMLAATIGSVIVLTARRLALPK